VPRHRLPRRRQRRRELRELPWAVEQVERPPPAEGTYANPSRPACRRGEAATIPRSASVPRPADKRATTGHPPDRPDAGAP
jgi:hypothetical protein